MDGLVDNAKADLLTGSKRRGGFRFNLDAIVLVEAEGANFFESVRYVRPFISKPRTN